MKRILWALILFLSVVPAWAAKKISVTQLEDLLHSLQQDRKSDAEVATALKQVELSQELTRSAMNSLVSFVPGPLSTEQIYVLEARSADLTPPEADLPATAAPDAATQKSILEKAAAYVTGTYSQLPSLTATKTTLRFQDNVEALAGSSGLQGGARDVVTSTGLSHPASFVHFILSTETQVTNEHGQEKTAASTPKAQWGANKMIALNEPDPNLAAVFRAAESAGALQWLRWELINGKSAAVFSFAVPSKTSHLKLDVCCFPKVDQAGVATFYTALTGGALGGGGGGGGVAGNFQTNTEWHKYEATVPYHGEFFIDPDSGIVVRMLTQAELKPTEVVHEVDTRIDYGVAKVGDRSLVVPVKTFVQTEVVPYGESGAGTYTTRCTLFTSEYKNYQMAGAK